MVRTETLNSQSTILPDCKSYSCKDFGRITLFVIGIIACILGTLILLHVGSFSQIDDAWGWGGVGGGVISTLLSCVVLRYKGSTSSDKTFFVPDVKNQPTPLPDNIIWNGELEVSAKCNQTYKGFYVGNDRAGMDMIIKVIPHIRPRAPFPVNGGYANLLSIVKNKWAPAQGPVYDFYLYADRNIVEYFNEYGLNRAQALTMHEAIKQAIAAGKKVLFYHEPVAKGVIGGEIALFIYQMLETNQNRDEVIADFESEFSIEYPRTSLSMLGMDGIAESMDKIIPPTVEELRTRD